ncbi:MAG: Asp-tRNA(Asn)/Glu-tRNA(Gln) amidotransferase GatCAB subunit C [Epsilonproteobacteria bacterium]|nr:MAG: Asp-tRNA(Asn)/Glu-tRNA(Gln) amidotransferase GatCAB subunit C [Campylobacterota bacterium]
MHIDDKVLTKLEKLSHLRIDKDKKEEVKEQLSNILSYIDNLNELNTDGLLASFSTLSGGTPMREDLIKQNTQISIDILSHSKKAHDDFFIVPAIIE